AEQLRAHVKSLNSDWEVVIVNDTIALFHPIQGDLSMDGIQPILEDNDATHVGEIESGMLTITASFRLPMGKPGEELGKQLHAFFDQGKTLSALSDWKTAPFGPEIDLSKSGEAKDVAWTHEGSLFELYLPVPPSAIDVIKKFLMSRKVEQLKLRLC